MSMPRYPLKIHLITLTTVLVTLVGGSIGWLAHDRTTRILHESTTALTEAVSRGVAREIALREERVRAMLSVIATHDALRTEGFESRAEVIDALAQALRASPQLVALYVGYGDGDYLLMRHVDGPRDEAIFETLPGTRFVIQHIERGGIEPVSEYIYLDVNLDELGRRQRPEALTFDPRQRPCTGMHRATTSLPPDRTGSSPVA